MAGNNQPREQNPMALPRLIPEWELDGGIVVAWPEPRHPDLVDDLVAPLAAWAARAERRLAVALPPDMDPDEARARFVPSECARERLAPDRFFVLRTLQDIWIQDWAPFWLRQPDGRIVLVKTRYAPRYLMRYREDRGRAAGDDQAGRDIAGALGVEFLDLPLVWDGGNLTHNGEGVAIVTGRLLCENGGQEQEAAIREMLRSVLGITTLVIVDEERGDDTGHIDGMVRFVSRDRVLVGSYPAGDPGARFMDTLANRLMDELGAGFQINRLVNAAPENEAVDDVASAVGNYINFLRSGDRVLVPAYDLPEDAPARQALDHAMPGAHRLDSLPARRLARLGGVFRCATWTMPAGMSLTAGVSR